MILGLQNWHRSRKRPLRLRHWNLTDVSDLTPLKGAPLLFLNCTSTKVSDLTPIAGAPMQRCDVSNTPISDLSPLKGMPLLDMTFSLARITKGMNEVRTIKKLEGIHVVSPEGKTEHYRIDDFWKKYDAGEFKK